MGGLDQAAANWELNPSALQALKQSQVRHQATAFSISTAFSA